MGWSRNESLRAGGPVEIPISALTRHICILGATGSGKSTTASVLVRGLASNRISTVILDRTGEYVGLLEALGNVRVYKPGDNLVTALFQYDGAVSLSLQVEGWLGILNHFSAVTYGSQLSPLQSRVLREVLSRYYTGTHDILTVSKLISKLEVYEERFRQRSGWEESIEALISRLVPLTVDIVGRTFDLSYTSLDLESLFDGKISVFDMSAIEEDGGKNLLSQMVLKRLYQLMRKGEMRDQADLAVILDEAQHLAPNEDYISVPERCAIELRKYGFSLVTIATRPSLISPNILSNSSTIISHLLINERDIDAVLGYLVGGSENSTMKRAIRTLPTGSAVVQRNFPIPTNPLVCSVGLAQHVSRPGQGHEGEPPKRSYVTLSEVRQRVPTQPVHR